MNWLAVYTNPGCDLSVRDQLKDFETLCLVYRTTVCHARKVRPVIMPLFPRYLFAKAPFHEINRTRGVNQVLQGPDGPLTVPDSVILELALRGDPEGFVDVDPKVEEMRFKRGEQVRVQAGPFMGFLAVVDIDKSGPVRVWIDSFGQRVRASFERSDLEQASP